MTETKIRIEDLPTVYDAKSTEEKMYKFWEEGKYFEANAKSNKPPHTIVIPPPNVTGVLHMGHALDGTLQDILTRYHRMAGYEALWLPGTDHAGLATQNVVERELAKEGLTRHDLGREKFVEKTWEWANEHKSAILNQFKRLGASFDRSRERFTFDQGCSDAVKEVFVTLYNKGLIYKGAYIVNWCPRCMSAISDIETEYETEQGHMWEISYPLVGESGAIIVATTRPETMFGDVAIAVHPSDKKYSELIGKKVMIPLSGRQIPIIADEYVDIEFGTGAMKCTPAHDPNDFIIGQKYGFPAPIIMNDDATMNELCGEEYVNLDRYVCREKLLKKIEEEGNLIKIEDMVHQVGHSERSGAVVEPMLKKQWFVKMTPLAEASLKNQASDKKVEFIPERFNKIFTNWMENCEDWCISRQLWWGHRIPAYYHKETGEVLVSLEAPKDIENYIQDEDVLDTWFSSALWPFSTLGWPNQTEDLKRYYPIDVMVTAYDIIFFWVSRMIFQGIEFMGERPFDKCLIHGLIRDAQGRKMSKSLGNGIDPIDVINTYGVDALRYFLTTSTSPGLDTRYSDEKIKASETYLNKIWNASRFILMNIEGEEIDENIDDSKLELMDKFILSRLETTIKNVTENMDKYDFANASTHLYNFVYDDFTSWYVELCKVKLASDNAYTTKQVLIKVLKSIILMIYPYTPFIAEEIYLNLPGHKESIMLDSYPEFEEKYLSVESEEIVNAMISMIKDVRVFKVNNNLAPNTKVRLFLNHNKEQFNFDLILPYLYKFAFAKEIIIDDESKNSLSSVYKIGQMFIEEDINKEELLKKIDAKIVALEKEVERCNKMLSNPNFVSKAPKEKIELETKKLNDYLAQLEEYKQKKASL